MPLNAITACDVQISIDNDGGVLTEVSHESNLFGITLEHQAGEYKTFFDTVALDWFRKTQCGRKGEGSIRIIFDPQTLSAYTLLKEWWRAGGFRTMRVDIPRGAGGDRLEFEAIIVNLPIDLDPASPDAIMVEFTYQISGVVTFTNIGT